MKYTFLVVGKTKDLVWQQVEQQYLDRLKVFADIEYVTVKAASNMYGDDKEKCKIIEGELLVGRIPKNSFVIVCDEQGHEYTSRAFADFIQKSIQSSGGSICIIIGGTFGLAPAVTARADAIVALSQMTFTHEAVRGIVLEQLYRSHMILTGRSYHY